MKKLFIIFLLPILLFSEEIKEKTFDDVIDYWLSYHNDDQIPEDLFDQLNDLAVTKTPLDSLSPSTVSLFFWLDAYQKNRLIHDHPKSYNQIIQGKIISDPVKIDFLRIFTYEKHKIRFPRKTNILFKNRYFSERPNIPDSSFQGKNYHFYQSYLIKTAPITLYFISEKDRNEKRLFDYYHIAVKSKINKIQIMAGDFQVDWGQGLNISKGFNYSCFLANPLTIHQKERGASLYKGASTNHSFRGTALNWSSRQFSLEWIAAYTPYDANTSVNGEITSLYSSGYHRDSSEIQKIDRLKETLIGSHLNYKGKSIDIGLSWHSSFFNRSFEKSSDTRKENYFFGKKQSVFSFQSDVFITQDKNSFSLFHETAYSINNDFAFICGLTQKNSQFRSSLLTYYYGKEFHNIHSSGVCLSGNNRNQKGVQGAVLFKIKKHKLSFLSFFTSSLERTYLSLFPTKKKEFQANYQYKEMGILLSRQSKSSYSSSLSSQDEVTDKIRATYCKILFSKFRFKLRYELKNARKKPGDNFWGGLIAIQTRLKTPIAYHYQDLAFFDTDDYTTRIYLYSMSLPGLWSIPSFYNKGFYLNELIKIDYNDYTIKLQFNWTHYKTNRLYSDGRSGDDFYFWGINLEKKFDIILN